MARFVMERMSRALGQPFVVENRAGADTKLGAQFVARAEPDGYTVLVATNTTFSGNLSLFKSLEYNPRTDFLSVGGIFTIPLLLTVAPEFPAGDVQSLIRYAQTRELSYGYQASAPRIAAELLKAKTGIKLKEVPYRGAPQALTDLMGRQIDILFSDPTSAKGLLESDKVKAFAVTSRARVAALPNIPTMIESGVPEFEIVAWNSLVVPTGTPKPIIAKLSAALQEILRSSETAAYFKTIGSEPFPTTAEELNDFVNRDIRTWAEIVKTAGIEPQ